MAKFKIFFIASLLFVTLFSLKSCKKKVVKGCTDSKATNFSLTATEDDGSCTYPPAAKKVGDAYQGGLIFYVDGTGQHGLISATADQSGSMVWSASATVLVDHTLTAIGTGATNTVLIVSKLLAGNYAASVCNDLASGGFSDWYLPSKEELKTMYTNLKQKGLGNFALGNYWTSSEISFSDALCYDFSSGTTGQVVKTTLMNVRAIRSF